MSSSRDPRTIAEVNALSRDEFVELFGGVFEDSPHLAEQAWESHPFADRDALLDAFDAVVARLDDAAGLALLEAHPQLGARGPMGPESADEQQSAGLTDIDAEVRQKIAHGNFTYYDQFGFPFIIAVRGLTVNEILAALEARLELPVDIERSTALVQVRRIGAARITQLVQP